MEPPVSSRTSTRAHGRAEGRFLSRDRSLDCAAEAVRDRRSLDTAACPFRGRTRAPPLGGAETDRSSGPLSPPRRRKSLNASARVTGRVQVRQQAPYVARGTAEAPLNSAGTDVGCGSLADGHHSHQKLGGKPRSVTAFGRDGPLESSSLGTYIAAREGLTAPAPLRWTAPWGTQWGQTDGREALGPGLSGRGGGSPFGRASGFGLGPFQPTILPFGACGCPWGASGPIPPLRRALGRALFTGGPYDSYLVDSASSHMLVSKIKPCMSKYKQLYCETANGSLNQL